MYLLASLIVQNVKILKADPELRPCVILGPKMAHSPPRIFSEKQYNFH